MHASYSLNLKNEKEHDGFIHTTPELLSVPYVVNLHVNSSATGRLQKVGKKYAQSIFHISKMQKFKNENIYEVCPKLKMIP